MSKLDSMQEEIKQMSESLSSLICSLMNDASLTYMASMFLKDTVSSMMSLHESCKATSAMLNDAKINISCDPINDPFNDYGLNAVNRMRELETNFNLAKEKFDAIKSRYNKLIAQYDNVMEYISHPVVDYGDPE